MDNHECKYEIRLSDIESKITEIHTCVCADNGTKGLSRRVSDLEADNKLFNKIIYSLGGVGAFLWGLFQVIK